ncbi:transcription antitermination factor NusB [Flavobacterium aurantiibacter]|nr:transcription antitermination factor NusB [Flavobacterium aurantiibacter]
MLNRRHIRVKVMQSIFAMHQTQSDRIDSQEKFLENSLRVLHDLYLLMLSALIEVHKTEERFLEKSAQKHLATAAEKNPNKRFIENPILIALSESTDLNKQIAERKLNNWDLHSDYINLMLTELKSSDVYQNYMSLETVDFEAHKDLVAFLFADVIVPNDKVYEYLEDFKMTWADDFPVVNTHIIKELKALKPTVLTNGFKVSKLYKMQKDEGFGVELFRKTILNEKQFYKFYENKTPNWDIDRIAEVDVILLNMAICELTKFPSIPVKVTLNEYVEIAKEYSTPNSSKFINGVLDALVQEFKTSNQLPKTGRGLL